MGVQANILLGLGGSQGGSEMAALCVPHILAELGGSD